MDERTWEQKLADILKKEPAALTQGDIDFLKARRSYLTEEQLATYGEVLGLTKPEKPADKPAKKKSE